MVCRFLKNRRRTSSNSSTTSPLDGSLRSAVRDVDIDRVIELLANQHLEINGAGQNGITALHEAAVDGNINIMKALVDHGAKINVYDSEGFTPLDYAVFGGNFECASYLIENGAKDDRVRDGQISYHDDLKQSRSSSLS